MKLKIKERRKTYFIFYIFYIYILLVLSEKISSYVLSFYWKEHVQLNNLTHQQKDINQNTMLAENQLCHPELQGCGLEDPQSCVICAPSHKGCSSWYLKSSCYFLNLIDLEILMVSKAEDILMTTSSPGRFQTV